MPIRSKTGEATANSRSVQPRPIVRRGKRGQPEDPPAPTSIRRQVSLDEIIVPRQRLRRDLGDLGSLAESLHRHGQLAPLIVAEVDGRYQLIAGERRLAALRELRRVRAAGGDEAAAPVTVEVLVRQARTGEDPIEI